MNLAHLLAVGLLLSYSLSAYAQRGETDDAIGANVARASNPPAKEDEDWGDNTQDAPKKPAPSPAQAPLAAPERAQPVAAPSAASRVTDELPATGDALPNEEKTPQRKLPVRKANPAAALPKDSKVVAPESDAAARKENGLNPTATPAAVDPIPETNPALKPALPAVKAPAATQQAPAPKALVPAPSAAKAAVQQALAKPVGQPAAVPVPSPLPAASAVPPVTIPVKQFPAGVPLPANAAATSPPLLLPAPAAENTVVPVKDNASPDLTDDLRADPNTSTSANRANARARLRPSDVGLSPQQTNAILAIRKGAQTAAEKRLLEELKLAKVDLNASMIDATSAEEVRKKFDLVQMKYLELQKIKFERTLKIREVLSVDQRKKLQGLKNSH